MCETTREEIREILYGELSHFLDDIEYRVAQAYAVSRERGLQQVYVEDLHDNRHRITGYTVTAHSPTAPNIAWTAVHIVYNGIDYTMTAADTTTFAAVPGPYMYVWFDPDVSTTVLQQSNTKPVLGPKASLIFINQAGVPTSVLETSIPPVVANGAIDQLAIQAGAVGTSQIASGAVNTAQIASGAVNTAQIAGGAVGSAAIANGAVLAANLGSKAVGTAAIADGAVGDTQVGSGVSGTKLANGTVGSTQITDGSITNAKVGTGIDGSKLGAGTVGDTQIATGVNGSKLTAGTVGGTQLANGSVLAVKLNVLSHVIY